MPEITLPKLTWAVTNNVRTATLLDGLISITVALEKGGYRATINGTTSIELPDTYEAPGVAIRAAKSYLRTVLNHSLVVKD